MRRKWIIMVPIGIAAIAVFTFIGGQSVKLLWNWLLPPLFGFPEVTFWQGLGLLALCRILFGGIGGPRGPNARWRHREHMSAAEREGFRRRMRAGFGEPLTEQPAAPTIRPTV